MAKLDELPLTPQQRAEIEADLTSDVGHMDIVRKIQAWGFDIGESSIRRYREANGIITQDVDKRKVLGLLAEVLERNGIDVEDIGTVHRVNLWQAMSKDDDGNPVVTDLAGIQLSPKWADGPQWPVVQQAPPVVVKSTHPSPLPKSGAWKTAVILPDIQSGYYEDAHGNLIPTHDEAAVDVALQIVAAEDPDLVIIIGDAADLAEFGKYRLSPAFQRKTQPTINWLGTFGARLNVAAPRAKKKWLAGNHEERMPNYLLDNAAAAFGLKRANAPSDWPVLSIPFLCRFDEYGIEYLPGWPANEVWINERLKVIHGMKVTSNGSTVHKYLDTERVSTISGHIHRIEKGHRTRRTHDGGRTIMAASPGCLCRVDGKVPSTKGGTDLDGVPLTSYEDWQQGVAVVRYEEGDGRFVYADIPIFNGWALWREHEFTATTPEAVA